MDAFNSPFIVPLGGAAVAIVAIVAGIMSQAHAVRVKADQRMAMLARGMSVAEIEQLLGLGQDEKRAPKDPLRSLGNARRTGIILVSSGIGIMLFFLALTAIIQQKEILSGAAVGFIPLAIGIGFFIDYNLQKRELARFGLEVGADLRSSERL
ncbi:DUF6249 domain-containing protein [Granulicella arctica]|uniref:DUF6249 domain-containing protein n=1 Tax=Granulicella arctica TaxID=940613 RepID=UPI0021E0D332|nr:DUF6249 domain-containing protein [Granulicella arctica]